MNLRLRFASPAENKLYRRSYSFLTTTWTFILMRSSIPSFDLRRVTSCLQYPEWRIISELGIRKYQKTHFPVQEDKSSANKKYIGTHKVMHKAKIGFFYSSECIPCTSSSDVIEAQAKCTSVPESHFTMMLQEQWLPSSK